MLAHVHPLEIMPSSALHDAPSLAARRSILATGYLYNAPDASFLALSKQQRVVREFFAMISFEQRQQV
jgi:hypothetical protein